MGSATVLTGAFLAALLTAWTLLGMSRGALHPRRVLAAYWMALVGVTVALYSEGYLSSASVIAIAMGVLAFTFGVVLATLRSPAACPGRGPTLRGRDIKWLVIAGTVANLVAAVIALRVNGFSLVYVFSLDGLLNTANDVAVARYSGGDYGSIWTPPLLGIGYAAALVAPFLMLTDARSSRLLPFAPVLSSLAYAAVTTERLGLLTSASLTAGGFIAAVVLRDGEAPRLTRGVVLRVLAAVLVVGASFTTIAFLRVGQVDSSVAGVIWDKQTTYALGSVPAFFEWYGNYRDPTSREAPLGWGTASIAGVEFVTGQSREATRAYGQFVVIDSSGRQTNVYTMFRGLILDFGESGALLVLTAAGFGFGRAYRAASVRRSALAAGLLACGYAMILLSNTTAITTFSNICAAMALGVWVLSRQARSGGRHSQPKLKALAKAR